jgi:hypothetical protein
VVELENRHAIASTTLRNTLDRIINFHRKAAYSRTWKRKVIRYLVANLAAGNGYGQLLPIQFTFIVSNFIYVSTTSNLVLRGCIGGSFHNISERLFYSLFCLQRARRTWCRGFLLSAVVTRWDRPIRLID